MFKDKRTYITVIAGGVVNVLQEIMPMLPEKYMAIVNLAIVTLTAAFLRAGIQKSGK